MNERNRRLIELRKRFDAVIQYQGVREKTATRYQSWIRRFLKYCLDLGIDINQDSAVSFLRTYTARSTQRQGYYALKFFFLQIVRDKGFFEMGLISVPEKKPKKQKNTWWLFS